MQQPARATAQSAQRCSGRRPLARRPAVPAARGWSNIAPPDSDPSYNFSVIAAAQASVSRVDKWSANTSANGYFNKAAGFYSNGVTGQGLILVRDEITLPSTAG